MVKWFQMALVKHRGLFELLEVSGRKLLHDKLQPSEQEDSAAVSMRIAIETMLEELAPNLWEDDLDRLVDFGHLISPELEMVIKQFSLYFTVTIHNKTCWLLLGNILR